MVSFTEPVVVNHGVYCWASNCESWWVLLCQLLWIMVCYAESVVVNYAVLCLWIMVSCTVQMAVIHGLLCYAIGCESWWVMRRQWLWIVCAMLNQTVVNHAVLFLADCVWVMVCYAEPLVINDMSQWLWIMVFYAGPVDVNHGVQCWRSDCESWCYDEPVVVNHGLLCCC
jgi:hypothetical protein